MKSSSSMKMLPVNNIYQNINYENYYNTNYQVIDNIQPIQTLHRQESSSLLPVRNNLLNMTQQSQKQIPQIKQTPIEEIGLQNIQPKVNKSNPQIIRIQKKILKRNIQNFVYPKIDYSYDNFNRNYLLNDTNYYNTNNLHDYSSNNVKPNDEYVLNNYQVTTPIKQKKEIYDNNFNLLQNYNYSSQKEVNKYKPPSTNVIYYYSDYKKYNSYNFSNIKNDENNNYLTDINSTDNDDIVNSIPESKINMTMQNLTSNYLQNNNTYNYNINKNNDYSNANNINYYSEISNPNNLNDLNKNLFNIYYNYSGNNYFQTDIYNQNNSNIIHPSLNKLTPSHSSGNIRQGTQFQKYNNYNYINKPIKLKHNFIRSISSGNINSTNKGWSNNLYKDELIPKRKIQNITIIKDPQIYNNINYYKEGNYFKPEPDLYDNTNTINNNSINNNYNINFNININHDYNNPSIKTNINPNNNFFPIVYPESEPPTNFNLSEFIKLEIVGKGTEGIIYSVKWKKNNKKYALKKGIIKLVEVVKKRQEEINMLKDFRKKTGSDGVINIYGYLCTRNKQNSYDFYEIMELAERDWEQEIENRCKLGQFYSEYELMNIMYQIVQTFTLLQKNHITHRDIKPQNIILVNGKYKIIDFGNARILKRDGLVVQRIRGSEMYMSPVMFKAYHSKIQRIKHNTFKSDVFSLGMCFLLAATLTYDPLNNIREEENFNVINKIVRNAIGQRYSEKVYTIILSMLQVEENLRPDFEQLEFLFRRLNGYI